MYDKALAFFEKEHQEGCMGRKIARKKVVTMDLTDFTSLPVLPESKCITVWKDVNLAFLFKGHKD